MDLPFYLRGNHVYVWFGSCERGVYGRPGQFQLVGLNPLVVSMSKGGLIEPRDSPDMEIWKNANLGDGPQGPIPNPAPNPGVPAPVGPSAPGITIINSPPPSSQPGTTPSDARTSAPSGPGFQASTSSASSTSSSTSTTISSAPPAAAKTSGSAGTVPTQLTWVGLMLSFLL